MKINLLICKLNENNGKRKHCFASPSFTVKQYKSPRILTRNDMVNIYVPEDGKNGVQEIYMLNVIERNEKKY